VIVLDLVMYGTDGRALLERFVSDPEFRSIPIVVCTAATLRGQVEGGLRAAGAVAVIRKPFDLEEFVGCIRTQLEGAARHQNVQEEAGRAV
jgi:CheY-like chemotaxis protein